MSIIFEDHLSKMFALSIHKIDKTYSQFEYFEESEYDEDYTPSIIEEVQFDYKSLQIYIDVEFQNDRIILLDTLITNQEDKENKLFTKGLKEQLTNYYNKENISLAIDHSQALAIRHDQNDPYNLRPAMPISTNNTVEYRQRVLDLCTQKLNEQELSNLFQYGTIARQIQTSASFQKIVDNMMEIIDANIFPVISKEDKPSKKAKFLDTIFAKSGKDCIKSYQRSISNYYPNIA